MKRSNWGIWMVLWFVFTSCGGYYRMTSRVNRDGSMIREVYASADSAFMAGDDQRQPFLFRIDSGWEVTRLNPALSVDFWGEEHFMNVKVSRLLPTVGTDCFRTLKGQEFMHPLVIPKETLQKNFRWFYTYYTFEATYQEFSDKGPIPLSRYMSVEEQQLWFRGDRTAFEGWNGMEMKNALDELDAKFWQWFACNKYEVSWQILHQFASLQQPASTYLGGLTKYKENVFKMLSKDGADGLELVCHYFDELGKTNRYSQLYQANKSAMDALFHQKTQLEESAGRVMRYELSLPGELIATNAPSQIEGLLTWRVDVMRLLNGKYVLTAQSRTPNYWAFSVTFLLILLAAWAAWKLRHK